MSIFAVLGGAGVVGRWITGQLATPADVAITVDLVGAVDLHADATNPTPQLTNAIADADVVVLALPANVVSICLDWLPGIVRPTASLLTTCSVQAPVFAKAEQIGVKQLLTGINPTFSPTLTSAGRAVALIAREHCEVPGWLPARLYGAGMSVVEMTPGEHDETMSYLQALPHAAVLGFITALAGAPIDADRLLALAPPPVRSLVALACRILTSPTETYWEIQHANAEAVQRRSDLRKALDQLDATVSNNHPHQFKAALDLAATWLGAHLATGARQCQMMFELARPHSGVERASSST